MVLSVLLSILLVQATAFTPSFQVNSCFSSTCRLALSESLALGNLETTVESSTIMSMETSEFPKSSVLVDKSITPIPTNQESSKTIVDTNIKTWKRRLDTHEDPFNVHKWAGLGWIISSTLIFASGTLSGFTEVPAMLEPITYLFIISTIAQSLTSIPMAIKYRANEPAIQRGFISSAISSSSLALTGFWLGPFGDHNLLGAHLSNLPDFGMALVALIMLGDSLYNLNALGDVKEILYKISDLDPVKDSKAISEKITEAFVTIPVGLPMNVAMLQQLWVHATDARTEFLNILVSRGSSSDMVFYASIVTSIAICVGNLAVTLRHRKLISDDINNLSTVGAVFVTVFFNLRAAGLDMLQ
jgi:hypothetical protein